MSDDRPLIGVTGLYDEARQLPLHGVADAYVQAVWGTGALPLLIPNLPGEAAARRLLPTLDGLLLSGGVDVDPGAFGEEPQPGLGRVSPRRDTLELPLARAALDAGVPLLAVCRGSQVLNVAAGGTLYQDLGTQLPGALQHSQDAPRWHASHSVTVQEGTRLATVVGGQRLRVNSFHHQAVRDVAPGLIACAWADDGVVEGVEHPGAPFVIGVGWHPEAMVEHHEPARRLFAALAEAAGARRGQPVV